MDRFIGERRVLTLVDDAELVHGMPVGLQIITGRFGEEKAVGIAKLIESLGLQTSPPK